MVAFEVSPDGQRVAVASEKGKVAVFTLASGYVWYIQPEEEQGQDAGLRTVPTWRSNDELCFAVPKGSKDGSPDRAEIVLRSEKGVRCISKNWPESLVEDFLK